MIALHGRRKHYSKIEEMVGLAKKFIIIQQFVTIEKVIDETPTVRTLKFSDDVMS